MSYSLQNKRSEQIIEKGGIQRKRSVIKSVCKNYQLYLFVLPTLVYIVIFNYVPMYGIVIAFKDFSPPLGFMGSPWVGFEHFERFFRNPDFLKIISNTIGISLYSLIVGFPFPILLALMLNYTPNDKFKKTVQTVTYAPHFISTVVIVGMMLVFLSPRSGIVNSVIKAMGGENIFFMAEPGLFKSIYVWSGVWQHTGWGSIIYLASLSSIDPSLHESAKIDGASTLKRIWHIDLPGITPTIVILLILNAGSIMSVGFEKAYLMQNSLNLSTSEIISTYVYKKGLQNAQFSFSAAVGLFNSIVNFVLLVLVNKMAKKLNETSLW